MSDIVKRLRECKRSTFTTLEEAAAEIERLRADLAAETRRADHNGNSAQRLRAMLEKAVETFADFETAMRILGRDKFEAAARIAKEHCAEAIGGPSLAQTAEGSKG